jgi:hypothetical protein
LSFDSNFYKQLIEENAMSHKIFRSVFCLILIVGLVAVAAPQSARAAGPWYVSPTGSDANDCLSPTTTCATINGAIEKASSGDTVYVAEGLYTGIASEVVRIDKNITISGGWDAGFSHQGTLSTIDGQGMRRGINVLIGVVATVERFQIRNGFLFNFGGGISNGGTLTLNSSIVSNNSTDFGGGIANTGALTLNKSTVSGNLATTFGGGIHNHGMLTLNNSTVSGNSSTTFGGGGIANSGGTVTLNNSTISGNSTTESGGGILNAGGLAGTITLNHTTVSNNSSGADGGGIANFSSTGTVTLNSSIVAGNRSGFGDFWGDCLNFRIAIVSQGYNLTGSDTGCDPLGGTGDVTVTPASVFTDLLGVLANNGGPTQTHTLLPGSNPALDAIPSGTNHCGSAPFDTDQRGVARPQGAACDIGAFELQATGGVQEVPIDIIPGSQTNLINRNSLSAIPVAILSTVDFNALSGVDRTSLTFGRTGDEHSLVSCNTKGKDVNGDGLLDLVCNFNPRLAGFHSGDTLGILKGQTLNGVSIEGQDTVRIVKK